MGDKPTESYRTHSNYIRAFSELVFKPVLFKQTGMHRKLYRRICSSGALPAKSGGSINRQQVQLCLHNAWGTEALLRMTEKVVEEEELLRLSNNWSVIQAYYIFYHSTQALHVAKGQARPVTHAATQNIYHTLWGARPVILEPWTLSYGHNGVVNSPVGVAVDTSVHSWSQCDGDNRWSLACKSLMTTRREVLKIKRSDARIQKKKDKKKAWRKAENQRCQQGQRPKKEPAYALPQLTSSEKESVESGLRPFTLMDYFYRLRVKTNYEDSNMFIDGPEDEVSSRNVRNALCKIADGTLFLHELAINNILGSDTMRRWANSWTRRNLPNMPGGLRRRLVYY